MHEKRLLSIVFSYFHRDNYAHFHFATCPQRSFRMSWLYFYLIINYLERGAKMHTVIKGTKTIAEFKEVQKRMEQLAIQSFENHKKAFETWTGPSPLDSPELNL